MKLKLIAIAAMLAAAGSANAAIDGATSGNGSLLLNFTSYNGAANAGSNDASALFDLGLNLNDALAFKNTAGFTQTWSLTSANYGSAWNDFLAFNASNGAPALQFSVIALDNTGNTTTGGARYLTTATASAFPSLLNSSVINFQNMDRLVTANNTRGTHATEANGASWATQADGTSTSFPYYGNVNGPVGDKWAAATTAQNTANLDVAQNFWYLTTSSTSATAQATKTAFGVDLNNDGTLSANELGKWTVNYAAGTVTFANPVAAVPEPETYAMLLAGLGLMGAIVRRRRNKQA